MLISINNTNLVLNLFLSHGFKNRSIILQWQQWKKERVNFSRWQALVKCMLCVPRISLMVGLSAIRNSSAKGLSVRPSVNFDAHHHISWRPLWRRRKFNEWFMYQSPEVLLSTGRRPIATNSPSQHINYACSQWRSHVTDSHVGL